MSEQESLKSKFLRFREKKYAIYIGLALTFIVCSILLVYSSYLLCFGLLLVALAGYYIPYYFGLRDRKKLAIWGVVLILLLSIPYTVSWVDGHKALGNTLLSTADGAMVNGTVDPFYGDSSTVHDFTVLVTDPNYSDVRVIVFDVWSSTQVSNLSMVASNTSQGTLYTYSGTLQNQSEYGYWFLAYNGEKYVTTSDVNYGPMHVTDVDLYVHWLPLLIFALLIEVGLLYFLLLILGWWTDKSKARLTEMQRQRAKEAPPLGTEKGEMFICSECGAEVPGSASLCPQCGERFDDEKDEKPSPPMKQKEEFVCTECGATVDEKAKTCWNCGKEFED